MGQQSHSWFDNMRKKIQRNLKNVLWDKLTSAEE